MLEKLFGNLDIDYLTVLVISAVISQMINVFVTLILLPIVVFICDYMGLDGLTEFVCWDIKIGAFIQSFITTVVAIFIVRQFKNLYDEGKKRIQEKG